jgi:hypothetical protein
MLPFLENIEKAQKNLKSKTGFRVNPWPFFILGAIILLIAFLFATNMVSLAISIALFLAPLWLPVLLVGGAWMLWVVLKRSEFIFSQKMVLLEIKPPRDLVKTPLAMEAFLSSLNIGPGEGDWYVKFIKGAVRPWWSLEIASLEGQVHFFIWTRTIFRQVIEAQMYAQYPGVQIIEAPDYTRFISGNPEEFGIWGCDYTHTEADSIPIKTYVEYGLDKVQKEPEQVDPLANIVEFLGSIGKGEYLWLQFVIRMHKGEKYNKLNSEGKPYTWKDQADELVKKIRAATREAYTDPVTGKESPGFPSPTKGQADKISAIERNVSKQAFDVGARAIYIAKKPVFNPSRIQGLIGLFNVVSSKGWNGMRVTGGMTVFTGYPWEIGEDKRKDAVRREMIEAYRRRQFFFEPFFSLDTTMVMSTEEIATIFHVPSRSVETPTLGRIQSATSEAPSNLPV